MKFFGTFLVFLSLTGCSVPEKPVTFTVEEVNAIIREVYTKGAEAGYGFCVKQKQEAKAYLQAKENYHNFRN